MRAVPRLVICADDYAISEQTSCVILRLLAERKINATSCLVEGGSWKEMAEPLKRLQDSEPDIAVGLHLNLTDPLPHCAFPGIVQPWPVVAMRSKLMFHSHYFKMILSSFRAQWAAFIERFRRPPDFIDGHMHVHLLPVPRRALFELIWEVNFAGWVRQCRTTSNRTNLKRLLLDPLSDQLGLAATAAGIRPNPGFGGLRRFDLREDVLDIWRVDIGAMRSGGVLMVHPGDAVTKESASAIEACRMQEARALGGNAIRTILDDLGFAFDLSAQTPWKFKAPDFVEDTLKCDMNEQDHFF